MHGALSCPGLPLFLTPPSEPAIQASPNGNSSFQGTISCDDYLPIFDLFEDSVTDYEFSESGSDDEDDQGSSQAHLSTGKGTSEGIRKVYKKESQRSRRLRKWLASGEDLKPHVLKHRLRTAKANAIRVGYSVASDADATKPGWVAKRPQGLPKDPLSLAELCGEKYGLKLLPWDGRWVATPPSPCFSVSPSCRTSHVLLDRDERVVGVLVGQPQDRGWRDVCKGAYGALHKAASKVKPGKSGTCGERRGISVGIAQGISLGPGLKVWTFATQLRRS